MELGDSEKLILEVQSHPKFIYKYILIILQYITTQCYNFKTIQRIVDIL